MLLIGSQAFDMGRGTVPKDFDYIATPSEVEQFKLDNKDKIVHVKPNRRGETVFMMGSLPIEFDTSETGQTLLELVKQHEGLAYYSCNDVWVAYPELLLTLKLTHRYMKNSPHFHKTMADIRYLRDEKGFAVPEILRPWMKDRIRDTYWYKHPSLAQNKMDFFADDGVGYIYDHDTIHEAVKTFDVPAFEMIKMDAAEVFCSKEKFYEVSEEVRLATVLEESLVLALERAVIPNNYTIDPLWAFKMALMKVCTSIASGWWREYAWENYETVLSMYREDYVDRFKDALAQGKIAPYVP